MIRELANLNYIEGRHSGKWDCCEDKESIGDEYLDEIFPFAREYGIPFEYELKDNFDEESWEEFRKVNVGYAMDELGHDLKELVQKRIIDMIVEEIDRKEE